MCVCERETYLPGAVHVVPEGEEGVGAEGHVLQGADPVLLLRLRQRLGNLLEHGLPGHQVRTLSHTVSTSNGTLQTRLHTPDLETHTPVLEAHCMDVPALDTPCLAVPALEAHCVWLYLL